MNTITLDPHRPALRSEVARQADFSQIRYAQCWEDADVLLRGLDVRPGDDCLVIASAGDNALAMLTRHPSRVVALDLSPAQLHALALRVAAYRVLEHAELLELVGSRPSGRRPALYARCRKALSPAARRFWDVRTQLIEGGIGAAGRFENYLRLFRQFVLPLAHTRDRVERLLTSNSPGARARFYDDVWCNRRWQMLARAFFSRWAMGRLGRDPSFFAHVEGTVADRVLARVRHAVVDLDPSNNPYLHWILTGRHGEALPLALRPEHFETIRDNLDRLSWHEASLEGFLATQPDASFSHFGMSNLFEYVSRPHYHALLEEIIRVGRPGGRLAYWNLFVPRSRPEYLASHLLPCEQLAQALHEEDQTFFYQRFIVEALW
ncbi:MAG: DUF3419 family protein [Rhodothermales bacterium]